MAGDAKKLQPIIVKKIKKGGHAHHGGAWKIAYADFVTAMMAFFLLMWLLGSTTEGDKKGIADFFSSPLKVALLGGGSGSGDSAHIVKGGGQSLSNSAGQVRQGEVPSRDKVSLRKLRAEQARAEAARLEDLKRRIEAKIGANPMLSKMASQIRLDMVRDGLRIQIVDEHNRPMFASGSASVQPYMRELLREIGRLLTEVPNRLTLEGHTDAHPFGGSDSGYTNWELSSDRANASRRELAAGGAGLGERVLRVQGLASSVPFDPQGSPLDAQNRRISIIVMNREAEDRFFRNAPEVAQALGVEDEDAPQPGAAPASSPAAPAPITPSIPSIRPTPRSTTP